MKSLSNEITIKYKAIKEIRHGYSGSVRIIPKLINVSFSSFSLPLIFFITLVVDRVLIALLSDVIKIVLFWVSALAWSIISSSVRRVLSLLTIELNSDRFSIITFSRFITVKRFFDYSSSPVFLFFFVFKEILEWVRLWPEVGETSEA